MRNGKIKRYLRKMGESQYRIRILLIFFAVAVVAMGIIDVTVFRTLSVQIREESDKENWEMLNNLKDSYENQVVQYQNQAQQLYMNLNIKAYLVSGGREDYYIRTIYESMKAMAGNITGISSVILFHEDEVLASYDTCNVSSEIKEEIVQKIKKTTSDKEVFYVWSNERKYKRQMVVFRSEREFLNGPSNYGVALAVNIDAIQDKVLPKNDEVENPIAIFHESGEIVAMQKDTYKEQLPNIFEKVQKSEEEQSAWNMDVKNDLRMISYVKQNEGQFLAVKIEEKSDSQEQIFKALRTILLASVMGMLAIAVVVWILSGWIYRPLGEIFRKILSLSASEENFENGKNELILADRALENVKQNMDFLKNQIRNNAVVRFLRQSGGQSVGYENVFDFGDCPPKSFAVIVFRYYIEKWEKNEALLSYVKERIQKEVEGEIDGIRCYRMRQGEVVILAYSWDKKEINCKKEGTKLLTELEELYDLKGCMGISRCEEWEKLPKTYKKAELLTEYYILSKRVPVLDENEIEKRKGAVQEKEKEKIFQYIKSDSGEDISPMVHQLLINIGEYSIEEAKKYLKELIADVIRLSENILGDKRENYEMYLEDFLTNQIFIGQMDIEQWLCELFIQVKEQLKVGRQSTAKWIMGEVTEYIQENYSDCTVSVEAVAAKYGLSVSYFSKLFNGYMGKTFPDYINQTRLKAAKKMLLEEPERSIQDVAKMVGFNSSSYFSAAFRKYYGVSPSQIRKVKGEV